MLFITQVPLGIMMKNENKLDEMVAIMLELGKYVPCQEVQEDIVVDEASEPEMVIVSRMHHILFGGDQLTVS